MKSNLIWYSSRCVKMMVKQVLESPFTTLVGSSLSYLQASAKCCFKLAFLKTFIPVIILAMISLGIEYWYYKYKAPLSRVGSKEPNKKVNWIFSVVKHNVKQDYSGTWVRNAVKKKFEETDFAGEYMWVRAQFITMCDTLLISGIATSQPQQ